MIRLVSDTIDRDDINALTEWLQQDPIPRLTKGDLTKELEARWAKMIGTKYSVFVNSGSSAIFLLLAAYKEIIAPNASHDPRIIVPALSWATDVSSPMLLGYSIKLCDCNLHDLSCDLDELRKLFEEFTPNIFLSVAPLGLVPNMNSIIRLCDEFDVILIEDNCESMGSYIDNKMLGSFGDSSVFSMYYGHHLSTIEGGFINTSNEELYNVLLSMRSHGWDRDWNIEKRRYEIKYRHIDEFNAMYTFYYPGLNVRSTDLQAFIGIRQLEKLKEYADKRNYNFYYYKGHIEENLLDLNDGGFVSSFAYPVVDSNKKNIVKALQKGAVEVRPLIAGSIGKQPFWKNRYGIRSYPNADLIHEFGFYLPNHHNLTEEEIDYITDIINNDNNTL